MKGDLQHGHIGQCHAYSACACTYIHMYKVHVHVHKCLDTLKESQSDTTQDMRQTLFPKK